MPSKSLKMMIFAITIYFAACVPLAASLTEDCQKLVRHCVVKKLQEIFADNDPCSIGQNYVNCIAGTLGAAEQNGTCDRLSLLAFRHGQHEDAISYQDQCSNFDVPSYLQLTTDCDRRLALCGNSVLHAFTAREDDDYVLVCRKLDELQRCMENITVDVCSDQQSIRNMLQAEMNDFQFRETCVGTTRTTTTTPTTTTTTTTASTTTTPTTTTTTTASTPSQPPGRPSTPGRKPTDDGNGNHGNPLTSDHCLLLLWAILGCLLL
ncbi:uncharacterized protein LOC143290958 [Babylonia areolata]|uniref:uncharacterized protein LOC143290958 n=1 Tax=Babylonia areolata TaxID=304850 RepID=UPI003FCF8151